MRWPAVTLRHVAWAASNILSEWLRNVTACRWPLRSDATMVAVGFSPRLAVARIVPRCVATPRWLPWVSTHGWQCARIVPRRVATPRW